MVIEVKSHETLLMCMINYLIKQTVNVNHKCSSFFVHLSIRLDTLFFFLFLDKKNFLLFGEIF